VVFCSGPDRDHRREHEKVHAGGEKIQTPVPVVNQ